MSLSTRCSQNVACGQHHFWDDHSVSSSAEHFGGWKVEHPPACLMFNSPCQSPWHQRGQKGQTARCCAGQTCRGTPWEMSGCSSNTGTTKEGRQEEKRKCKSCIHNSSNNEKLTYWIYTSVVAAWLNKQNIYSKTHVPPVCLISPINATAIL